MDDDDLGMGPLVFFRLMSQGLIVVIPILVVSLLVPSLLYLVARWRAHREPVPDPQLGIKVALSYFQVTSYQLMLAGAFFLLWSMLSKGPSEYKELMYRPAFGVVVPAGIIFGIHSWALTRTNHRDFPQVGRLFAGYSLMLTGLLGTAAMIAVFVVMFQKGESGEAGRFAWAMFLVYTTAWVIQAIAFVRRSIATTLPEAPLPPPPPPPPGQTPPPASDKPPLPPPMAKPLA